MSGTGVVVFDVNETLSDLTPLEQRFTDLGASASVASLWFTAVLRDGFALTAAGGHARFADLGRDALLDLLPAGLDDPDGAVQHVLDGFMSLRVHPDVVPGVRALRAAGLRLVTLSNGAPAVAERLLVEAGIRDAFEDVLSVEQAGVWKPAPGVYRFAAARCGVPVGEMLMVAVHPWDLDGAARAGMQTAWVDRRGRRYPSWATPPDHTVATLGELAGHLG